MDVWLPEAYDSGPAERFPVIYMHDGQFMFDRGHSPYVGTDWLWDVDRTMTRLIGEGEIRPAIIVSVWMNETEKASRGGRIHAAEDDDRRGPGSGYSRQHPDLATQEFVSDNYLKFLVQELKPSSMRTTARGRAVKTLISWGRAWVV